jgi:menaquinone-dependent protoporphyrinogen oxidase
LSHVLIVFASSEGQAARIAERIAARLRHAGHRVDMHRHGALPAGLDASRYEGVIVGASVHFGKHPRQIGAFVRRSLPALRSRPSAFFSVSLSAGGPVPRPSDAQAYVEAFLTDTGWRPAQRAMFAGALRYAEYPAWKRFLMGRMMRSAGGDTDTSRDHEYTDWEAVSAFADRFSARLAQKDGR